MCVYIDTPVIQRMLRIGAKAATANTTAATDSSNNNNKDNDSNVANDDDEMILLFVRIVGEPYCCLGPVSLLNCNVDRHPLVFHWQLLEFDNLVSGNCMQQFQRILKVSPMS